jgi:hypothetical protein
MNLSKKTQFTILIVLLSSVISSFLTKNHLDIISFPMLLIGVSLGVSLLTLILPSKRNKEEFHKQFNYTYTALCLISVLIYLINN